MAVARALESSLDVTPKHASSSPSSSSASKTKPSRAKTSPGPKRKLPKMNSSERAKYYRRRIREYMAGLENIDNELRRQVYGLMIVRQVQQRLALGGCVHGASRQRMLAHLWEFLDQKAYLKQHILSHAQFHVRCVEVCGAENVGDEIVLRLDAEITGVFSQDTIEKQLYTFVPGNTLLLDKLLRSKMVFQSAFRFYFNTDGALVQQTSETDFVAGLVHSIGCSMRDVSRLVAALGDPAPLHTVYDANVPPPPSLPLAILFVADEMLGP